MFYHIEGVVSELEQNLAVIDCSGVGFALNASMNTVSGIKCGDRVKLYVSEAVSENSFELYGFLTKGEKHCFEMLTAVSGIGPKAAMSILSYNTPESLALAVMSEDIKALTVAPGIGKKTAQRVILELKDKVSKDTVNIDMRSSSAAVKSRNAADSSMNDALSALAVLGYSSAEISPALNSINTTGMTAEQIIKAVLKLMVK